MKIVDRKLYWDKIKDRGLVYYVLKIKNKNETMTVKVEDNFYSLEKFKDTHVSIKVCCKYCINKYVVTYMRKYCFVFVLII